MNTRIRQRGAALMAMLVVVVIGGAWWLVSGLKAAGNRTVVDRSHNARVLAEAKAALLAWAASTAADPTESYPGRLPCPEGASWIGVTNAEGIAAPGTQQGIAVANCARVGRLPWRTLGLDKLVDADGEPLWYVVTTGANGWALANATTVLSVNSNKANMLTVDGNLSQAVAVIIAPGAPMTAVPNANQTAAGCVARTQQRTPSAPNVLDYLECQSTSASPIAVRTRVVDNASNKTANDQMVVVTAAEVLAAVEPMVAQRIQTQVLPQLQGANALYASSDWGKSAANPAFPFAVTFGDPGTTPTSNFKGTAGKTEGLLPVTALSCAGIAASRCDSNFHTWNTASISATLVANGPINAPDCSTSTTAQVRCTFSFTRFCLGLCFYDAPVVQVRADAANVGLAMRTLNTGAATGLLNSPSFSAALQADGSARVTYSGSMTASGSLLCGPIISVICSGSAIVRIPIGAFQDHAFLNPTTADNWYWFFANNWHHVTYYAIAPVHQPGGAGSCTAWAPDCTGSTTTGTCLCLTVKGGSTVTNSKAVLTLAGRSLNYTSGTNRALTDFLDSNENRNADLKFEQYKGNRTFNDRFVSLSP
jgi:hypothetical protein